MDASRYFDAMHNAMSTLHAGAQLLLTIRLQDTCGNLPTEKLVRAIDWCGVKSGREVDKFAACGLHAAPGSVLTDCPVLEESPVNLECRITQRIPLGSHDLFLAEVVACDVDESLLDEKGKLCLDKANLIVYSHGEYLALGKKLGTFGYSVRKKKPAKRKKQ